MLSRGRGGCWEHLVGVLLDCRVALAGGVFEGGAVDDLNVAAAVADQSCALQEARCERHRGAAHAEHLAEKFLGERDGVAAHTIVGLQQPATEPRFQCVQALQATDC